ncbi:MAG TPA: hypothetical protein VJ802_00280 [Gemmatimonadaceae bacterium]|nr:hypothetical protein [Gemmatimonadaceae bacterium]
MRLLLIAITWAATADAQKPTRDDYHRHLPPPPSIVAQTDASARLDLYGNRGAAGYVDRSPVDGIDDTRARRLLAIIERFSPILRRNNFAIPRHFLDLVPSPRYLHVDAWRGGRRISSDSIGIDRVGAASSERTHDDEAIVAEAIDDDKLRALVDALHPRRSHSRIIPAGGRVDTIVFVDLAGDDERSWRRAHEGASAPAHVFAHVFLDDAPAAEGPSRIHFEIQYWFYYPFNDSANNHEGDWEHMTVCVTTRARAMESSAERTTRGLPTEGDVARILDPASHGLLDSLIIREVDYYFHHNVMTLDYLGALEARVTSDGRARHENIWEDEEYVRGVIEKRVSSAHGRLATHPIGYVGGNNLGPDELLRFFPRFHRSYNRNSDATYPFPGVWLTIGPLGMTEKVRGPVVPRIRSDATAATPWRELIADDSFITFGASQITIVPDWERLDSLVLADAGVRRRWSWVVLPIRWGFPAVASPGAGSLAHTNMGNLGPFGPTFNNAWNRRGETEEYHVFEPTVLHTPTSPTTPWSNLMSGWGILNLPLAIFGLTPGGNVAVTQLAPWLTGALHVVNKPPSKTITPGRLPSRFTDASLGAFRQSRAHRFAPLLPHDEHPAIASRLRGGALRDEWGTAVDGPRIAFNLFFADRLSVENTLSWSISEVGYHIEPGDGSASATVHGELALREFTGGLRWVAVRAFRERLNLSARVGAGWSQYTVRGVRIDEELIADGGHKGGRLPSVLPSKRWIPNAMYGGVSMEIFTAHGHYFLRRVGYGLRAELTTAQHRLDDRTEGTRSGPVQHHTQVAIALVLGW